MNNNFISAEEFLEQSDKVQSALKLWWMPQKFDLYSRYVKEADLYLRNVGSYWEDGCILNNRNKTKILDDILNTVPLLRIDQLIDFIEDKIQVKIQILFYPCYGYSIMTNQTKAIATDKDNLLDALWVVVIKIIEEEK